MAIKTWTWVRYDHGYDAHADSRYARVEAVGGRISYDVPLEGWQHEPKHHIKEVGRAIGICEAAIDNEPLLKFVHEMGLYLGSGKDREQALTKMHTVHADTEREQKCAGYDAAIAADPECNAWALHNGSHAANGMLKFVRKCAEEGKGCGVKCAHGHYYEMDDWKSASAFAAC